MKAVISLSGHQHLVEKDQQIVVDQYLAQKEGESLTVDNVLLLITDKGPKIGTPTVKGAQVELKVLKQQRGPKIRVSLYKAKSRYRKTCGHRQDQTILQVEKIVAK